MAQIRMDVFPALVSITAAGVLDETNYLELQSGPANFDAMQLSVTRVFVTENQIIIARDSNAGPHVVFTENYDPTTLHKSPKRSDDSHLITLSGKVIAFRRDEQCGCGSRLKSWNPFRNIVMSSKDPTE